MADGLRWLTRHHPPIVTGALIAAVIATGVRFGVARHELPLSVAYHAGYSGRALLAGRVDTLWSSQLLTRDGFMLVSIVVSLAVMLGGYELLAGSRRAAVVAVCAGVAGPAVVGLTLGLGSALHFGYATRTLSTLDYGASAVTAGAGGALVAILNRRWLRRGAVVFVLGGLVLHHQLADWEHLVAFPLGYALAVFPRWPLLGRIRWLHRPARPVLRPRWIAATAVMVGASVAAATAAPTAIAAPYRPNATSSPIQVLEERYPTPSLGGDRRVLVVLPAGYDTSSTRYPVIELLHGRPGNPQDFLTGIDLTTIMVTTAPFIAVIPDGHGPKVSDGDFADTTRQPLGAALSDDLRRWADTTLRTNGHWGVTGLSAGGYGAAYLASRPAGGYQRVCPMSGYFQAADPAFRGEPAVVRAAASPILHTRADGPPTLLIVGAQDQPGRADTDRYAAALAAAGQPHQVEVVPGRHDLRVWRAAMPRCIGFLLGTG